MASNRSARLLGLPWIPNLLALAEQVNLSPSLLQRVLDHTDWFYTTVEIPKETGYRQLDCPSQTVKVVQAWILRNILEHVRLDESATAYIRGIRLLDNVLPHKGNEFFLCIDLKGFFHTVSAGRVYSVFQSLGYSDESAVLLTRFCTYKGRLPQGGVTSPYLSNIACLRLDRRIRRFVSYRNVTYTRYADDITLSASDPKNLFACATMVREIIQDEGFILNTDKTRVLFPRHSRRVTGLVIDHRNYIGVGRYRRKYLRARIHSLISGSMSNDERLQLREHIDGWLAYMASVDPKAAWKLTRFREKLKAAQSQRTAAPGISPSRKRSRSRKPNPPPN